MIDSQLVGTSMVFIESRICAFGLMCQVILHSSLLSSFVFVFLHNLHTDYLSDVFLQWIILCMETVCTMAYLLNFEQSSPIPTPPLPLRVAWQPSRMWQVEVFQAERGVTLPLSMQNWFWLVTQRQAHKMCYSSVDRPGEQRAGPSPTLMPSPMAADATWRPQSLQPARRRRRAPAGSPKPMSMSCTEKAFSAGRQAACRPLLSPFLGGRV